MAPTLPYPPLLRFPSSFPPPPPTTTTTTISSTTTTTNIISSLAYKDRVAKVSCPLVKRLEALGAVVIGKTNTPELGAGDVS